MILAKWCIEIMLHGIWKRNLLKKMKKYIKRLNRSQKKHLFRGLYELGVDFEKALLFHEYVILREALGQNYQEALENLFPLLINSTFEVILEKFQNEIKFIAKLKLT